MAFRQYLTLAALCTALHGDAADGVSLVQDPTNTTLGGSPGTVVAPMTGKDLFDPSDEPEFDEPELKPELIEPELKPELIDREGSDGMRQCGLGQPAVRVCITIEKYSSTQSCPKCCNAVHVSAHDQATNVLIQSVDCTSANATPLLTGKVVEVVTPKGRKFIAMAVGGPKEVPDMVLTNDLKKHRATLKKMKTKNHEKMIGWLDKNGVPGMLAEAARAEPVVVDQKDSTGMQVDGEVVQADPDTGVITGFEGCFEATKLEATKWGYNGCVQDNPHPYWLSLLLPHWEPRCEVLGRREGDGKPLALRKMYLAKGNCPRRDETPCPNWDLPSCSVCSVKPCVENLGSLKAVKWHGEVRMLKFDSAYGQMFILPKAAKCHPRMIAEAKAAARIRLYPVG